MKEYSSERKRETERKSRVGAFIRGFIGYSQAQNHSWKKIIQLQTGIYLSNLSDRSGERARVRAAERQG